MQASHDLFWFSLVDKVARVLARENACKQVTIGFGWFSLVEKGSRVLLTNQGRNKVKTKADAELLSTLS